MTPNIGEEKATCETVLSKYRGGKGVSHLEFSKYRGGKGVYVLGALQI
jgi:hypothetical protein